MSARPLRVRLYCPACEAPGVERTSLGYIGDDGTIGQIPGIACRACHFIQADAEAEPTITGHIDLGGQRAIEWFVAGLRAAGCDPRPHG